MKAPKIFYSFILGFLLLSGCLTPPTPTPTPPESQTDFWLEAHALISERHYGQALEVLEQAAQQHPNNADILLTIGQIYLAQQRWLLAEDAYNRAIAIAPHRAEAVAGLAETMLQQGNRPQALKFWQRATTLDPQVPGGFTGLGRTQLAFFNFAAAQTAFLSQRRKNRRRRRTRHTGNCASTCKCHF
jgi:tetratricopeptide (TPR) repeat protein